MTGTLHGKTGLVTGASRGIGRAVALRLGSAGMHVGVHCGSAVQAAAESLAMIRAAGGDGYVVPAMLDEPEGVERLAGGVLAELDGRPLDVLVNNAAIEILGGVEKLSAEQLDSMYAINVRAPLLLIQALLPHMPHDARIISISSDLTRVAYPEGIGYAMTKGAIDVMTRALAKELGPRGIRVNAIAPGLVRTDMSAEYVASASEAEIVALTRVALGRIGTPEEVAEAVHFLVAPASGWVTGQRIEVNGGAAL